VTRASWIARGLKPALWLAGVAPLAWIVGALLADLVDGDQVEFIQQVTGTTALVSLFVTLLVTPLRRLTGLNELIRVRRLIGLTAFWYALLHLTSYLVFDQGLSPGDIAADVREHPWVLLGAATFLLLVPLAVTSTAGWVRRLGGRRWRRLHLLVYPAAVGGVLHYLWLVKQDLRSPLYFAVVLVVILLLRVWMARRPTGPGGARRNGTVPLASPSSTFATRGEDLA
jgi:sulfoxide reductase heme-binding subunit YedZ